MSARIYQLPKNAMQSGKARTATWMLEFEPAEAKKRYAPDAAWNPESLAFFMQSVIQGAFVLAKAKQGPEVAAESLQHLHRYLETQFHRNPIRKERAS